MVRNFTFRRKGILAVSAILLSACAGQQVPIPSFPENGMEFGGPTVAIGRPTMVHCPFTRPDGSYATFETEAHLCNELLSGGEDEAGTTTQPTSSIASAAPVSPPVGNTLSDGSVSLEPDRVASTLLQDEGYETMPYVLNGVCHIGLGRTISAADCEAVDTARGEAQRMAGAQWDGLSDIRQDALTVFCYWTGCAGYTKFWRHVSQDMWAGAAYELWVDSAAPEISITRTAALAETLRENEWKFTIPITDEER